MGDLRRGLYPAVPVPSSVVIHRWGWTLVLNPDRRHDRLNQTNKVLHSHGPPVRPGSHSQPGAGSTRTTRRRLGPAATSGTMRTVKLKHLIGCGYFQEFTVPENRGIAHSPRLARDAYAENTSGRRS